METFLLPQSSALIPRLLPTLCSLSPLWLALSRFLAQPHRFDITLEGRIIRLVASPIRP